MLLSDSISFPHTACLTYFKFYIRESKGLAGFYGEISIYYSYTNKTRHFLQNASRNFFIFHQYESTESGGDQIREEVATGFGCFHVG